jgi:cysteine desulfurase/selenocysteine lyase
VSTAVREQASAPDFDVEEIRAEFPILSERIHDKPLVYLDNAASTQKPRAVLDAVQHYYEHDNANVHRGVHTLSERATVDYEKARETLARFLGAPDSSEIVWVRGATEALNLVAQSYGGLVLREGDEIVLSGLEHHSNIVPWQMIAERTGARIRVIPLLDDGSLDLEAFARLLGPRTRIVGVAHVSNALGTVNPIREIARMAHDAGAKVVVDGAQAVAHGVVNVSGLDCDFYAISGHKMYAPMGIGALWGRKELLERMPPWQGGGEMILTVTFEKSTYNVAPHKFEAGTPDVGGAIGMAAAASWLERTGRERIATHEREVLAHAQRSLGAIPGLTLVGTAPLKAGVQSFVLDGVHPHDVGTILDAEGIAIRTGHHCAQPVMDRFGLAGTARASFGVYNTTAEVDRLVEGLAKVRELFG